MSVNVGSLIPTLLVHSAQHLIVDKTATVGHRGSAGSGTASPRHVWQTDTVRTRRFNVQQRVVIVIGLGVGLYCFGGWVTTRGGSGSGWVAYAPLSNQINPAGLPGPGLRPWVRLVIWLALTTTWVVTGVLLLRSRPARDSSDPAD
jgi:hypothetical protein